VNYSDSPWTAEPWQAISYVSCHDNHTLFDKLTISRKDVNLDHIIAMDKLANAIVMTSQGIPFLHAGVEMLRTKNGEHNSYNLPDTINQIDWNWKAENRSVFNYYKNLIALRKAHPAFRMPSAEEVRNNLIFNETENGVVSYTIKNNANKDNWTNILIIYNANTKPLEYKLVDDWKIAVLADEFNLQENITTSKKITVPPISMAILFQL
jgi:pullulanase